MVREPEKNERDGGESDRGRKKERMGGGGVVRDVEALWLAESAGACVTHDWLSSVTSPGATPVEIIMTAAQ